MLVGCCSVKCEQNHLTLSLPCHCWVEVRSMLWDGELSDSEGGSVPTPFLSPGTG